MSPLRAPVGRPCSRPLAGLVRRASEARRARRGGILLAGILAASLLGVAVTVRDVRAEESPALPPPRRGYAVVTTVPRAGQPAVGLRLTIDADGLYAVAAREMAAAGAALPVASDLVKLFDARGEVPLIVEDGGDGRLDPDGEDRILFFGFYPRGVHTTRRIFNEAAPYYLMLDGRADRLVPPPPPASNAEAVEDAEEAGEAAAAAPPRRYEFVTADEARRRHPDPVVHDLVHHRLREERDLSHLRWPEGSEEETDFYVMKVLSSAEGSESYVHPGLFVGQAQDPASLPPAVAEALRPVLRARLYGISRLNKPDVSDHVVEVLCNDVVLGRASWDGVTSHVLEMPIPAEAHREGTQKVELRIPEDRREVVDTMYLDWVEIGYPASPYYPAAAKLHLVRTADLADPDGRGLELEVNSWDDVPYRLLDPQAGRVYEAVARERASVPRKGFGPFRTRFRFARPGDDAIHSPDSGTGSPLVAVFLDEAATPLPAARLAPWSDPLRPQALDADTAPVENVIISHRHLWGEAQRLAAWRHSTGTPTLLVEIEAVYDMESGGFAGAQPLLSFLRALWSLPEERRPRYLTLLGDSTFDYKGINERLHPDRKIVGSALLPVVYHSSGHYNRAVFPADNVFADLEGDDKKPELAVGRIPAATPAEARAYVDKVIAYESAEPDAAWLARALMVSSWERSFQSLLEDAQKEALPGLATETVVATLESRAEDISRLIDGLNEGCGVFYYVGHGGSFVWRVGPVDFEKQEDLFTVREIAGLTNEGRYPIVFVSSCYTVSFDHARSLGEEFLLQPARGGIAVLGSPWKTSVTPNHRFNAAVMGYLYHPERRGEMGGDPAATYVRLGDAFRATKRTVPFDDNTMIGFTLLGDPCLRIEVGRFGPSAAAAVPAPPGAAPEGGEAPAAPPQGAAAEAAVERLSPATLEGGAERGPESKGATGPVVPLGRRPGAQPREAAPGRG